MEKKVELLITNEKSGHCSVCFRKRTGAELMIIVASNLEDITQHRWFCVDHVGHLMGYLNGDLNEWLF